MAWNQTRNQIISRAYRILGVLPRGDSLSPEQLSDGSDALNSLFKSLAEDEIFLYKTKWFSSVLVADSEVIGSDAKNYTCIRAHVSDSTNEPITGSDWRTYWIQEGSAGGAWATATSYNHIANIVLDSDVLAVTKAFVRQKGNETDIPVELISSDEYFNIPKKRSVGNIPSGVWHNEADNTLYYYPMPSATDDFVAHVQSQVVIEDLVTPGANPDAPLSYYEMIVFSLAYKLSFEEVIPLQERDYVRAESQRLMQKILGKNQEDVDFPQKKGAF